ncbi:MAG: PAS domain S-box protein, partial [Methylophilaceae bacterium]|nr:PAS domain S-box protein [Methylophilaceae bacterium]
MAFNSPERDQNTHGASPFILKWLNNREHILNSLLSNLDGMAYCCLPDKDWTMLYISEGCMQLTGYSSEDFLTSGGITYEEITYPEDRTRLRDAINTAIKDNRRYDVQYRIIRSNGDIRWVAERGQSIVNTEGKLEAIEGFIQDITEKKASEQAIIEAEKRYRSIFENTVEGIFQTTPDGRYLSANPALAKIYGYSSAEELIGSLNNIEEQLYVDKNKRREFSQLMQLSERVTNFES